ncbi:MAG: nitroreductase family protein [Spirochaetia bacterium]
MARLSVIVLPQPSSNARRHSRRKFSGTQIETQKLDRLLELVAELNKRADACRLELVPAHDGAIFSGIRGGYGVIKGAPSYLAFIGTPDKEGSYEQLGYIGQAAVLEATRLELGTCWVSGTFDAAAAARDLEISPQEQVPAADTQSGSTAE